MMKLYAKDNNYQIYEGNMERKKHNTRGKLSAAVGGYGYISEKGYRRIWDTGEKRYRFEHDIVWESHFGKIPTGYQIHHKDGDKLNNDISNLEMVTALEHKRRHSECRKIDGEWWKPCRKCGELKHISDYYKRKDGISPWCRACCVKNAVKNKRKRRAIYSSNGFAKARIDYAKLGQVALPLNNKEEK